ncbi:membrane protein [Lactiplantibacillus plantarum]|nr:membrane protein [Lactiplantibacillus plantarum]
MSNLKILKNWGDNNLLELSVSAESEFVTIEDIKCSQYMI